MSVVHWQPPDPLGDLYAQTWRADRADPTAVHLRPEVYARLHAQRPNIVEPCHLWGLTLVVDERLPAYPGFEIHRTPKT